MEFRGFFDAPIRVLDDLDIEAERSDDRLVDAEVELARRSRALRAPTNTEAGSGLGTFPNDFAQQLLPPSWAPLRDPLHQHEATTPKSLIDWPSLEYIDEVDDNLSCVICAAPFHKPVISKCCDQTFCEPCLTNYCNTTIREKAKIVCPMCRDEKIYRFGCRDAPWQLLAHKNRAVVNLLDTLRVKCPDPSGCCKWNGKRSMVEQHVRDNCDFREVPCGDPSCRETLARSAAKAGKCLHRVEDCKSCGVKIELSKMQQHINTVCPLALVSCAACGSTLNRWRLGTHTEACWNHVVHCKHAETGCRALQPRRTMEAHEKACIYGLLYHQGQAQVSRIAQLEHDIKKLQLDLEAQKSRLEKVENNYEQVQRVMQLFVKRQAAYVHAGVNSDIPTAGTSSSPIPLGSQG